MTLENLLFLAGGLALLLGGAELLVRGASRLAAIAGISPLVVGLTVVAYGTSAPELAVSLQSALAGQADIALGNVIGSNIFNVLFILGLCALILPLKVSQQLVWLDVPILIGTSLLAFALALDGGIDWLDGVFLVIGAGLYTAFTIRQGRNEFAVSPGEKIASVHERWPRQALLIVAGLVLLVYGARWLVDSAVAIAQAIGISELVIGLTVVAAGTSLPEVATSALATIRGERDIAVGNVIGSCIFNLLFVLGLCSALAPEPIVVAPSVLTFDAPVMLAVALACAPIFFTGHRIERWEGALLLLYYFAYSGYLVLNAQEHDALPAFSAAMLQFVIPLTVFTLAITYIHHMAATRERGSSS